MRAARNPRRHKVRRSEHKKLLEAGDSRLSNSRYFWLSGEEQVSEKAAQRFGELKHAQLKDFAHPGA